MTQASAGKTLAPRLSREFSTLQCRTQDKCTINNEGRQTKEYLGTTNLPRSIYALVEWRMLQSPRKNCLVVSSPAKRGISLRPNPSERIDSPAKHAPQNDKSASFSAASSLWGGAVLVRTKPHRLQPVLPPTINSPRHPLESAPLPLYIPHRRALPRGFAA